VLAGMISQTGALTIRVTKSSANLQ
jgi:hypothetical protein